MITTSSLLGGILATYVFAIALSSEYKEKDKASRLRRENLNHRRRRMSRTKRRI